MAEEAKGEQAPAEAKKKSPIVLIIVLVVVGLVLAGGISFFVTQKMMADATKQEDNGASNLHRDPGVFIKLGDEKEGILVNVGGIKAGRFLKTSIVLEVNPGKTEVIKDGKLVQQAETKIMDTTLQLLRSVKIEELDASKQDELKITLRDSLNKVLGEGTIYEVYITSFLLQ